MMHGRSAAVVAVVAVVAAVAVVAVVAAVAAVAVAAVVAVVAVAVVVVVVVAVVAVVAACARTRDLLHGPELMCHLCGIRYYGIPIKSRTLDKQTHLLYNVIYSPCRAWHALTNSVCFIQVHDSSI